MTVCSFTEKELTTVLISGVLRSGVAKTVLRYNKDFKVKQKKQRIVRNLNETDRKLLNEIYNDINFMKK